MIYCNVRIVMVSLLYLFADDGTSGRRRELDSDRRVQSGDKSRRSVASALAASSSSSIHSRRYEVDASLRHP